MKHFPHSPKSPARTAKTVLGAGVAGGGGDVDEKEINTVSESEILVFPSQNRLEQDAHETLLLARMAEGDGDAAREIWASFSPGLLTIIFRLLGDRSEAEDVLQEAMMRIWDKAGSFDHEKGRPFLWAAMIARGLAVDALRKRDRRDRMHRETLPETTSATHHRPQDEAHSLEWVEMTLGKLNERDRHVVREIVLLGKTSVEMAADIGESDITIRSRLKRALQKLREIMQSEQFYGKEI